MSRAEFAKFGSGVASQPAPKAVLPVAPPPEPKPKPSFDRNLRILLFDEDPRSAATIRGVLHEAFGDHSASDWISDRDEAQSRMQQNEHDVHLCVDGPKTGDALAFLRAERRS